MKFKEIVQEYFPKLTAQILRERVALLRLNDRRARKHLRKKETGVRNAPDWTDDELQVLKDGLIRNKPTRCLLSLLPQRTLTSIRTKMSYLRKKIAPSF